MHPAQQYISDIQNGTIPSCKYVKWAVQRHVDDLERAKSDDYPYYFDEETAKWYIDLFQFFILYEGEAAGRPFDLSNLEWIQFQLWSIFGWKRKSNGKRRFRKSYVLVAKKNIKTTLAGCLGLIGLLFDGESGAQIYSAASNAKQAKICFRAAREIAKKSPALRNRLEILSHNIAHMESASFFEYISSQSAQTKDGLNPHFSIIDEYHAHPDNEVHDVLDSATAAREQPLVYIISTEGFNQNGPHADLRDYCIKIVDPNDSTEDDHIFFLYYTLDEKDDWKKEKNWVKANPSIGVSVKYDDLRAKAKTAAQLPSQLNNFLTKHMNVPVDAEEAFIPSDMWAKCNKSKLARPVSELEIILKQYQGRKCFGGLDLGSVSDFTCLTLAFEPTEKGDYWDIFMISIIPADTIGERKNGMKIAEWVREGWIMETPGNVTDHNFTRELILTIAEHVNFVELAYDRYKMTEMVTSLMNEGIEMTPFGQGYVSMNPAIDDFERLIKKELINHGGNPVLEWMMRNVVIKKDPAGNRKFDKEKATDKIDGVVSTAMAIGRAMLQENQPEPEWSEFTTL